MPSNQRVEDQAFGRTARQGKLGTGEMILNSMGLKQFKSILDELNLNNQKQNLTENLTAKMQYVSNLFSWSKKKLKEDEPAKFNLFNFTSSLSLSPEIAKKLRDQIESNNLNDFQNNELKLIELKDKLFKKFCDFLNNKIRTQIRQKENNFVTNYIKNVTTTVTPSVYETNIIAACEEQWSMLLRRIDDQELKLDDAEKQFDALMKIIETDFSSDKIIKNPYYHIAIGVDKLINESLFNNNYDEALNHFGKAIKLDENISAAAYAGLSWCLVNSKKGFIFNSYEKNYKLDAIKNFNKALEILSDEMAYLNLMITVLEEKKPSFFNSDLYKQLYVKTSILGSYINSIQSAINGIKVSLRLIKISQIKTKNNFFQNPIQEETLLFTNLLRLNDGSIQSINDDKSLSLNEKSDNYCLEFNDLTRRSDSGTIDQALNTILNSKLEKSNKLFLKLKSTQGFRIKEFFNLNIEVIEVTKNVALSKINEITQLNYENLTDGTYFFKNFIINLKYYEKDSRIPIEVTGDLKKIIDLIEKQKDDKFRYDLVINDANKHLSKLKKNVNLNQDVSIHFEFFRLNSNTAEKMVKKLDKFSFKSCNIKMYSQNVSDIIQSVKFKQLEQIEIFELDKKTQIKYDLKKGIDKLESLKNKLIMVKLDSLDYETITNMLNDLKKFAKIEFDIEFAALNTANFLEILEETEVAVKFEFIQNNQKTYENLIDTIRDCNFEFTIEFQNLDVSKLNYIIKNASLEQEEITINKKRNLNELFMKDSTPELELAEYAAKGIEYIIEISERKFIPWKSIVMVSILGTFQIVLGGLLIVTGFGASVGMGFISEGIADLFTAYRAYNNRDFNWTDYMKQKVISLLISAACSGLKKLKDSAKGFKNLISGPGTSDLVKTSLGDVGTTLATTTQNLQSLTLKHITVKTGEALVRETLNKGVSCLSNILLDSNIVKSNISESIQISIKTKFCNYEFINILRKMYALEKVTKSDQLKSRIDKIVSDILNPNNNFMTQQWKSIGAPLLKGILSDKFGSPFSMAVRIWGTLQGLYEIQTIINRVFDELNKKITELDRNQMSMVIVLNEKLKIDKIKAAEITSSLIYESILDENDGLIITNFDDKIEINQIIKKINNMNSLDEQVKQFLKEFINMYSNLTIDTFSMIMKSISDKLSDQVIRTIEGQLITPWTSLAVSSLTNKLSTHIQNKYLVDESQNSESQNKDKEKFEKLEKDKKDGIKLSEDDQNFMKTFKKENTFENQIGYNASDKAKAFTQAEIDYYSKQCNEQNNKNNSQVSKEVSQEAEKVKNGKPASIAEQSILEKKYGLNTKIIQDENYKPTQEEIDNGVQFILIKPGEKDENNVDQPGHAYLKDENGNWKSVESKNNDCVYAAFSEILQKNNINRSVDQLRGETANNILNNPNYTRVLSAQNWIKERYPREANTLLFAGAGAPMRRARDDKIDNEQIDLNENENKRIKNNENKNENENEDENQNLNISYRRTTVSEDNGITTTRTDEITITDEGTTPAFTVIANEGNASCFEGGEAATKASKEMVNDPKTPIPTTIVNQVFVNGTQTNAWEVNNDTEAPQDASHCLPRQLGGPGTPINILPMASDTNRGHNGQYDDHRKNEDEAKDTIKECQPNDQVAFVTTAFYDPPEQRENENEDENKRIKNNENKNENENEF